MSNSGKYSLLFTGLKDQDPTTLRKVKTVFVTDLELPIPEIQEILDNPPRCIISADQKNDLKTLLKSLKLAGALVEVVENGDLEEQHTEPAEEDDGFSFEIDLAELTGNKKQKSTKVWELSFDQEGEEEEEEPSLLDLLPPKTPPSELISPANLEENVPAAADPLEVSATEDNGELEFEPPYAMPEEVRPEEVRSSVPEEDLNINLEDGPDPLELKNHSNITPIVEQPSASLVTAHSPEEETSLDLADAEPLEESPKPALLQESADPLDLMLMSLDEDDEHDSSTPAPDGPRTNYDLQILEDPVEESESADVPNENELDLLLIDMDEEEEDQELLSKESPANATTSTNEIEPDTEPLTDPIDNTHYELNFEESDSSQPSEDSSATTTPQAGSPALSNFATNIDDLIPHLESQREGLRAEPQQTETLNEDAPDLTLGDLDIDTGDAIDTPLTTTTAPTAAEQTASSDEQKEETEKEETKPKAKPSFIAKNQPKEIADGETPGLTLKSEPDDDDEGPAIAYLSTQARLSRQVEQRKETVRNSILYGLICLAIFVGGNWILFSFVLNSDEERGPMIAPVTDADIKKVDVGVPEEPKTPLNPDLALIKETVSKELILQSKSPTFSLKATCGASDQGLVHCKISGEGVESQMPSKKDRANGIKQPPWLTKLESDEITFNLVKKDESRIAEGTANAYIMYDRLSNRVTANVTLRTSPPPPEDALKKETRKLTVEIFLEKEVPVTEGLEVSLTENTQFALAARAAFDF